MKVLFIYTDVGAESLAIEYLSSALKKTGHETDLIIEYSKEKDFQNRLYKKIFNFNPEFIAFSVVTDNYKWASKHSKFIKNNFDKKIVWGGYKQHPVLKK